MADTATVSFESVRYLWSFPTSMKRTPSVSPMTACTAWPENVTSTSLDHSLAVACTERPRRLQPVHRAKSVDGPAT